MEKESRNMNRRKKSETIAIPLLLILICAVFVQVRCRGTFQGGFNTEAKGASLVGNGKKLVKTDAMLRFGVFDFTDGAGSFTAFGILVGDETLYRLSVIKGIRLVERKRLQALISEANLEQSGLTTADPVARYGKILPVDILVTGSYVPVGDRIRVNGRFTDVHSGEIKDTFVYFLDNPRSNGKRKIEKEQKSSDCSRYEKMIEPALRDLRTKRQIEEATRVAISIPYTYACRQVHKEIMSVFRRGKIYPPSYHRFLHNTIIAIPDPEEVERKQAVLYYLSSDKNVTEAEWNTGLLAMKNASSWTIRRLISLVVNFRDQDEETLIRRADQLIELTGEGVFGRPHVVKQDWMFIALFTRGMANRPAIQNLRLHLLEKYPDLISRDPNSLSSVIRAVEKSIIGAKNDREVRLRFYERTGELFSTIDPEEKNGTAYSMLQFLHEIMYRFGKQDKKEQEVLVRKLSPWLCYTVTQTRRDYRLSSVVPLLEKYRIECSM